MFAQGPAHAQPLGGEEGIGHAAADDERIHARREVGEEVELRGNLGSSDDGDQRTLRLIERPTKGLQFRFHGAPCNRGV